MALWQPTKDQCAQCGRKARYPEDFIGRRGKPTRMCKDCQRRYRGWDKKTPQEKRALRRERIRVPDLGTLRARLFRYSGNAKLGGIPTSVTSRATCPRSCTFYGNGCFAEEHWAAKHWRTVGESGDDWESFLYDVTGLPEGTLWRHNTAGDLPGLGERIDAVLLRALLRANHGLRGFTFTHKHGSAKNRALIREANRRGLTVNLSADSLEEADRLAGYDVGPVCVVVPRDWPDRGETPQGRKVIVCPAETSAGLTCRTCQLCAKPHKAIVAFRAHGTGAVCVDELVRSKRAS